MSVVFVINHIYPDDRRREMIRSSNLGELREWAAEKLGDPIVEDMFRELAEWQEEGRAIKPMREHLSSSLEIVITSD